MKTPRLQIIQSVAEYQRFKKLYDVAVKNKETQFEWLSSPVLVAYAKYVLEVFKPRYGKIK